jgi:hypothetical protein
MSGEKGDWGKILCIGVSECGDDTGEEEGNSVEGGICAEVDEDHDVEFWVFECGDDVSGFETDFFIFGILCQTDDTDFPFATGKSTIHIRILQSTSANRG